MNDHPRVTVNGSCSPGFERVRDAFETNFRQRNEVGAAVAIWVDGELAVNLWGGTADAANKRPWQEDTLASIFSGSKALTSTCIHLLADRGELDLQAPVAEYWPEFAQAGKQDITVAMVMGHRSGVIGPRTRLTPNETLDWDAVCDHLARAEPWWQPGTAQGYHMVSFGFILGEIIRRVTGRTLGEYLRKEIAEPLGIDVHIGLPRRRASPLRRHGQQAPHPRRARRRPSARLPDQHHRASDGRILDRHGLHPRRRARLHRHHRLAHRRIPVHQRPCHGARPCHLLQRTRPRQDPQLRAHGEMPNLTGRLRH